ncbi:MAG: PDZ domain-containing protein [Planctomycetota bacterium]
MTTLRTATRLALCLCVCTLAAAHAPVAVSAQDADADDETHFASPPELIRAIVAESGLVEPGRVVVRDALSRTFTPAGADDVHLIDRALGVSTMGVPVAKLVALAHAVEKHEPRMKVTGLRIQPLASGVACTLEISWYQRAAGATTPGVSQLPAHRSVLPAYDRLRASWTAMGAREIMRLRVMVAGTLPDEAEIALQLVEMQRMSITLQMTGREPLDLQTICKALGDDPDIGTGSTTITSAAGGGHHAVFTANLFGLKPAAPAPEDPTEFHDQPDGGVAVADDDGNLTFRPSRAEQKQMREELGTFIEALRPRSVYNPELRAYRGVELTAVAENTLPWRGGLRSGDVLVSVNGVVIRSVTDFKNYIRNNKTMLEFVALIERGETQLTIRCIMQQ